MSILQFSITYLLPAIAMYIFVFLKAAQQRNVAFMHYRWVIPTSLLMAITEVYVIAYIAHTGYSFGLAVAIGLGAGIGAVSAMYLHHRYIGVK